MSDKVSFVDIESKVKIILGQTNYSELEAREKLIDCNHDEIMVIRQFFGLAEKKVPPISSLNQEIYKQIRLKLNTSIQDYNKKQGNLEVRLEK